jgi:hypothetical protein
MAKPGRKPGRDFESFPLYARKPRNEGEKSEKEIWTAFAKQHGWNRSEFIRLATNHALVCPLFLSSTFPQDTINKEPTP